MGIQRAYYRNRTAAKWEDILVYGKQLEYVYIYSLTEGNEVNKWKTGKGITNVIVANDGKQLFMADQNEQKVRFFTINGKETGSVSVGKGPLTMVQNDKQLHVLNFYDTQLSTIDLEKRKLYNLLWCRQHQLEPWLVLMVRRYGLVGMVMVRK